jgi:DNA helicase IV
MAEYRFSTPTRLELTDQQKLAIDSKTPLILNGVPGTGKTTISLLRFVNLSSSSNDKPILLTFGRLLTASIQGHLRYLNNKIDITQNTSTFFSWIRGFLDSEVSIEDYIKKGSHFILENIIHSKVPANVREVIIDEAQDINIELHKVVHSLYKHKVFIGADDNQLTRKNGSKLRELTKVYNNQVRELTQNYRNSYQIYLFACQFLPNSERVKNASLLQRLKDSKEKNDPKSTPRVFILKSQDADWSIRKRLIKDLINENSKMNIGILTYNVWSVNIISTYLREQGIDHTIYHSDTEAEAIESLKNIIVTTIKSCKGLEFDRVIIPSFVHFKEADANDYYVAATRAKTRLNIICGTELTPVLNASEFKDKYIKEVY